MERLRRRKEEITYENGIENCGIDEYLIKIGVIFYKWLPKMAKIWNSIATSYDYPFRNTSSL